MVKHKGEIPTGEPEDEMEKLGDEIGRLVTSYPELRKPLAVYRLMLEAQKPIRKDPKKGTKVNWEEENDRIKRLQDRASSSRRPISELIDPGAFDSNALLKVYTDIVEGLVDLGVHDKQVLSSLMKKGEVAIPQMVESVLKRRGSYFKSLGKGLKVDPELLAHIAGALVQPCLRTIASEASADFLDKWGEVMCPICGSFPRLAVKRKEEKRRFLCTFCGAEYATRIFKCPHCGNINPHGFEFFYVKEKEGFEVDYCKKCKRYYKVIDEKKLGRPAPKGLEDFITAYLDGIAKRRGLKRLDE